MKKSLLLLIMISILLFSCREQKQIQVPTLSPSPTPIPGPTTTSTPTRTPPPTFPATTTFTPLPPYQTKKIVVEYNMRGDHSVYDSFFEDYPSWSRLVLYEDGQIIIAGKTYKQKILSPGEMEGFLSKLEALGFYSLESNQKHDPTDKLYDYGDRYQKSFDGREYCIMVNAERSRTLCVYEPDMEFVVPRMKNILEFLEGYEPAEMTSYEPDRLLLWVQPGRNSFDENLPQSSTPWPDQLPPLSPSEVLTYVDGESAREIYFLYEDAKAGKVFTQNGKEYTVYFYVVMPHENLTNAYQ